MEYLLRSSSNGERHHLVGLSLEAVVNEFNTIVFLDCSNFVSGSNHVVCSGMDMMDIIMALKDHLAFKYAHHSRFLG